MEAQVVKQQKIGKNYDIIKLSIQDGIEVAGVLPILLQTIDDCFQRFDYKIILDMQRIKFPASSFIAFLIEITARARRVGGDIKLINLAPSATNNLVTFSPLSYLAVEGDETHALEELDALVVKRPEPEPAREEKKETPPPPQKSAQAEPENTAPADLRRDAPEPASLPDFSKATGENASEPESEPGFKIKEIKIELPDLSGRQTTPAKNENAARFTAQNAVLAKNDIETEAEPPQTKEVVIHPPAELKPKPMAKESRESTLYPRKTTPDTPETLNEKADLSASRAARKEGTPTVKRIRVKSMIESLYDICDFVTGLADNVGFSEKEVGKIKVTVYEACINVIEHAYHSDPDEWIVTTVQYNLTDFTIIIQDWGESFNFDDSKPYDVNKAVHDRKTGGFGLFIILRSMDEVKYKTDPVNGNRLILRKKIPQKT